MESSKPDADYDAHGYNDPERADTAEALPVSRLEEFWSELIEDLDKRHLPTFSLLSVHGNPISLSSDELIIGAVKDNFQKMLETKIPFIKTACQSILGKELHVKIKVIGEGEGKPAQKVR